MSASFQTEVVHPGNQYTVIFLHCSGMVHLALHLFIYTAILLQSWCPIPVTAGISTEAGHVLSIAVWFVAVQVVTVWVVGRTLD